MGHFVMAVFNLDAHGLHGKYGFPLQVGAYIQRGSIKISALVQDFGVLIVEK